MDYKKHYNLLIEKAQKAKRSKTQGIYYEKHHIIPKSEGGLDTKQNLVLLTAREHFIAHWLLYRDNPNIQSRAYAFWKMCTQHNDKQNRHIPSSRSYEEARLVFRQANSRTHKGKTLTEEHKKQISERRKGKPTRTGFNHTEETKQKISKTKKGTVAWNRGIPRTEAAREAISKAKKGKDNPKKWVPVLKIDPRTGTAIKEYPSFKSVEKDGFSRSGVRNCCYKNRIASGEKIHLSGGFKWIYKD